MTLDVESHSQTLAPPTAETVSSALYHRLLHHIPTLPGLLDTSAAQLRQNVYSVYCKLPGNPLLRHSIV